MGSENPIERYRRLKSGILGFDVDRKLAAKFLGLSYQLVVSIENGSRGITRNTASCIVGDSDVGVHFDKGELVCWEPLLQSESEKAA